METVELLGNGAVTFTEGNIQYCYGNRLLKLNSIKPLAALTSANDGFGGLVVSMLASGSRVRGFIPGRSRWIFTSVKILSIPSFGGEVKESVPMSQLCGM
jgi:hypothetical protein